MVMMETSKVKIERAEATVDDVKFAGEIHYGKYVRGIFVPGTVWVSMGPIVNKKLKNTILAAVNDGAKRGYVLNMTPEAYIKECVEDIVLEDGRKASRFHTGCDKCTMDYELNDTIVEKFRKALGAEASDFEAIVGTTVFMGMKWIGDWRAIGPEAAERDYEGRMFCVFHGVSTFKDAEVAD